MVSRMLQHTLAWIVGAVTIPLILVWWPMVDGASFESATQAGELVALAISVSGASLALEFIMQPGRLMTNFYQWGLLLVIVANTLIYGSTTSVADGVVERTLTATQHAWSVGLLIASVVLSAVAVARNAYMSRVYGPSY